MKHSAIYVGENTHIVEVELEDHNKVPQLNATVQLTSLQDSAGEDVEDVLLPIDLVHVASGLYQAVLPPVSALVAGSLYKATIRAVSDSLLATFVETLVARHRAA